MGTVQLSIGLLVFGWSSNIKKCINSLEKLRSQLSCELIVTDIGCTGKLRKWVGQRFFRRPQ
jgi:hypothetical protein